jgi:hypothetical protein
MASERIHRWDKGTILKALFIGALIEALAIAPAALSPWGHAGPDTLLGWLSLLLNMPGIYVLRMLGVFRPGGESIVFLFCAVFIIQTIMISYPVFVYLRWRKLKAGAL